MKLLSIFLLKQASCFDQSFLDEILIQKIDKCPDAELYDKCLNNCSELYLTCMKSCDSSSCQSQCIREFTACELPCRCGSVCLDGCSSCDHPLCQNIPSESFILSFASHVLEAFLISGDGASRESAVISQTDNFFPKWSLFAMVNDRLHVFGGSGDGAGRKIGILNSCNIETVNTELSFDVNYKSVALSVQNGTQGRILNFSWKIDQFVFKH